jgi:hypothetical protein
LRSVQPAVLRVPQGFWLVLLSHLLWAELWLCQYCGILEKFRFLLVIFNVYFITVSGLQHVPNLLTWFVMLPGSWRSFNRSQCWSLEGANIGFGLNRRREWNFWSKWRRYGYRKRSSARQQGCRGDYSFYSPLQYSPYGEYCTRVLHSDHSLRTCYTPTVMTYLWCYSLRWYNITNMPKREIQMQLMYIKASFMWQSIWRE